MGRSQNINTPIQTHLQAHKNQPCKRARLVPKLLGHTQIPWIHTLIDTLERRANVQQGIAKMQADATNLSTFFSI